MNPTMWKLITVCDAFSDVAEANGHYQRNVMNRLIEKGYPIEDLTIGEFIKIAKEETDKFNKR